MLPDFSSNLNMTDIQNHTMTETICEDLDIFQSHPKDSDEKYFADVIGCIEDIVLRDDFSKLHREFMEKHWYEFDDSEENKLVYTDIFKKYIEVIEKFIEGELKKSIPSFNMGKFEDMLRNRQNELKGEIFEMLTTFTDFVSFKTMFLDYKAVKEGRTPDFSQTFCISKYTLQGDQPL